MAYMLMTSPSGRRCVTRANKRFAVVYDKDILLTDGTRVNAAAVYLRTDNLDTAVNLVRRNAVRYSLPMFIYDTITKKRIYPRERS